jgi:HEPN domain-containing protein
MSDKVIQNWLKLAEYDFVTAKAMLQTGRYLYVVFTCQQTIEKMLKAIYVKEKGETPPYSHNLLKLIAYWSYYSKVEEKRISFLEMLNSFYIESRYSEEIRELSRIVSKRKAEEILKKTEELFLWLKKKI